LVLSRRIFFALICLIFCSYATVVDARSASRVAAKKAKAEAEAAKTAAVPK
jgi:hypothetical protein